MIRRAINQALIVSLLTVTSCLVTNGKSGFLNELDLLDIVLYLILVSTIMHLYDCCMFITSVICSIVSESIGYDSLVDGTSV